MAGCKHAHNSKQGDATCWDEDAALASFGRQIQAEGPVPGVNSCIHYHTCATFLRHHNSECRLDKRFKSMSESFAAVQLDKALLRSKGNMLECSSTRQEMPPSSKTLAA